MRSLFIRDCLSKGEPVFKGGARYNNIELEVIGITNAADSLYAVKKAVYDDKKVTFEKLLEALKDNFKGSEYLQGYLKKLAKFGNDCEELDNLRGQTTKRIFENFNGTGAVLGGIYVPGEVIFTAHEYSGRVTGATPDGRPEGVVLADSAGASQGRDISGPTALLNSVLKIPVKEYLLTTVVVNLKFSKDLFNVSKDNINLLFKTFFKKGGMQLQINVISADELLKAVDHPDEYRSLIVRIGGYSDYFVNLSKSLQQEIIKPTVQEI
jgi:formate C-acetyltransferase